MITVSGLTRQYGKRLAVDDMTFDVAGGRGTGFVGPNGAGKSTTMRMMVGLTRPDSGEVRYDGVDYSDLKWPARTVGCVLDARMHPGRTALNHLRATAAISRVPAARAEQVLAEVGLETAADQRATRVRTVTGERYAIDTGFGDAERHGRGLAPELPRRRGRARGRTACDTATKQIRACFGASGAVSTTAPDRGQLAESGPADT